jgi:hypothetical protein
MVLYHLKFWNTFLHIFLITICISISLAQDTTNYIQLTSGEKVYGKVELKEPFLNIKSNRTLVSALTMPKTDYSITHRLNTHIPQI